MCVPLQSLLALHEFKQKYPEVDLTPISYTAKYKIFKGIYIATYIASYTSIQAVVAT